MTSRTGNDRSGIALLEVLVACVILFAGVGAVLKAYALAAVALDRTADGFAARQVLGEVLAGLDLQVTGGGTVSALGSGSRVIQGRTYRWEAVCRQNDLKPEVSLVEAVISTRREAGGWGHTVKGEWAIIRTPEKKGAP